MSRLFNVINWVSLIVVCSFLVKYAFLPLQQVHVYKLTSKQAYLLVSAILQRIKLMRNVLRSLTQSIRCHIANI